MLIICEKSSAAKDFARALKLVSKGGYYAGGSYALTYCAGHLYELYEPEMYNPKYKKWSLDDLPIIPGVFKYKIITRVEKQNAIVRALIQKHINDKIMIATDADREGELIARIVLNEAGLTDISKCSRFWVSEALTDNVVQKGMGGAKPLSDYNNLALSAYARQRSDWLIGMNISRFVSLKANAPFSVGRVQTAVLNAVLERNQAITNFKSSPYYQVELEAKSGNGVLIKAYLINPSTGKINFASGKDYINSAITACVPKTKLKLENSGTKKKSEKPPKLFNITGLQKEAYNLYGYKPDETLNIAEKLYDEYKCLSYPRTPSNVMGDDNVSLFKSVFDKLSPLYEISKLSNPALINVDNKHIFNSKALEAHHALIPLGVLPDKASEKERNVFELVVNSFFRVCMDDFIYNEKTVIFSIKEFKFISRTREVLEKGFKKSLKENKKDGDDDLTMEVSYFDENNCYAERAALLSKETKPPKEFVISSLLAFMENPRNEDNHKLIGLGTSATRAEIIKTLFEKGYIIEEKGKKLYAARQGVFLIAQLKKDSNLSKLTETQTTTEWEEKLSSATVDFEKEIAQYIKDCLSKSNIGAFEKESIGKCPACGKNVYEGKSNFYCAGYKDGCKFVIWKEIAGAKVTPDDAALLLSGKDTKLKKCKKKDGSPFNAKFYLNGTDIKFKFDKINTGGKK